MFILLTTQWDDIRHKTDFLEGCEWMFTFRLILAALGDQLASAAAEYVLKNRLLKQRKLVKNWEYRLNKI
jgi:hypothetical protein